MTATPAYDALKAQRLRIHRLEHLQAVASWDRLTYMPAGAAPIRAAAQGELAAYIQKLQVSPETDRLLKAARDEPLAGDDAANLALMQRDRIRSEAIPADLLRRRSELTGTASSAWGAAKAADDWHQFEAPLAELVASIRECAERLGDALGLSPYDALLDGFDRGLTSAKVEQLFAPLRDWLPDQISAALERQAAMSAPIEPQGPFDPDTQKALCARMMETIGFDFSCGRLDVSAHPFTSGTPEDTRLTTRFSESQCLPALKGIIHETGHGLYQTGLPAAWRGQALGEPCSAAMHEAQALTFERQLAPTPGFARLLSAMLTDSFGAQPGFDPDNLLRLLTWVRPGRIRVEADELTYPAHILLRTEIELALFAGEIEVADIPRLWEERMMTLTGVDTGGSATEGPLQDIHWAQGMFGYFPSYLLGAMTAAQLFAAFRRASDTTPDDDPPFAALRDWLSRNVWAKGARLTTEELVRAATGEPLSGKALQAHLSSRYGAA